MRLADLPRRHSDDGDGPGFALLVLALVCVALLTHGCGASALQRQASAAAVTRVALDATAGGIETACTRERVEADGETLTRCIRLAEGHGAARAAWDVWASAIILASDVEDDSALDVALTLALPVARLYAEMAELLRELGVPLPLLPDVVTGLLGGES